MFHLADIMPERGTPIMGLLDGRTILISGVGTSTGVGTAAVEEVRKQGGTAFITCHPNLVDRVKGKYYLPEEGMLACDFSEEDNVANFCSGLRIGQNRFDGFLHSVANSPASAREEGRTFLSMTTDEMVESLKLNAMSFHWMLKHLMGNGDPERRILNNGAVCVAMTFRLGSQRYIETYWAMAGAKALLDQISLFSACELGPKGVRVHSLDAGPMKTAASRGVPEFNALYHAAQQTVPSRRNMTAADAAWGACMLMSPNAEMFPPIVTMDGGLQQLGIIPVKDPRPE